MSFEQPAAPSPWQAPSPKLIGLLLAATLCVPAGVEAQRVDDNTVTTAQDAFGVAVSGESLGLYDPNNARGFSPSAAGNVRIEGLYFDQQGSLTSRLVDGYRILIGPSALGQPFQAPSGIANFSLRTPGKDRILSLSTFNDDLGTHKLEADALFPNLLAGVDLAAGGALNRYGYQYGGHGNGITAAASLHVKLTDTVELVPFWSRVHLWHDQSDPIVLFDGTLPAPPRAGFTGQPWAGDRDTSIAEGILANARFGAWTLRSGVFRSSYFSPLSFSTFFLDAPVDGEGGRAVTAEKDQFQAATSGEVELSRRFADGPRTHELRLAAWGRDQLRRYGAIDTAILPAASLYRPSYAAEPDFTFGDQTHDRVRQISAGLSYQGSWRDIGEIDVSVAHTDYRKTVAAPGGAAPVARDAPTTFNASIAAKLTRALTLYAGTSHGFEESDVAPTSAVNRNEAPPAIRTRQVDGGVNWLLPANMKLIAGAFEIEKPYYGLDGARLFRPLGTIRNRGLELSLAGSPTPALTIVGGALALDAQVTGELVDAGTIGRRPVGSTPLSAFASANYVLPFLRGVSVDLDLNHTGRQVASVDTAARLPALTTFDAGLRYRFALAGKPFVLRLQAANLTDRRTWSVAGSDALQGSSRRQLSARLTTDL